MFQRLFLTFILLYIFSDNFIFVWHMIKDVVKNAVFMNGSYEAGYQGGKLVFDIITTVLTGETGGVKNIITAMKKVFVYMTALWVIK